MTSTPNSSFDLPQNHHGKTAHNAIGQRKSKRLSKRAQVPIIVRIRFLIFVNLSSVFLSDDSSSNRGNCCISTIILRKTKLLTVNWFLFYFMSVCVYLFEKKKTWY